MAEDPARRQAAQEAINERVGQSEAEANTKVGVNMLFHDLAECDWVDKVSVWIPFALIMAGALIVLAVRWVL